MKLRDFEEWVNTPGREVITMESDEIAEFIEKYKRLEDYCFDLVNRDLMMRINK